jgi:predicted branched-subunit amino acid permease
VGGVTPPRSIRRDALGVGVATGAYGLSFGAIAVAAGFSVAQACALSLLAFTGASQFALVGAGGAAFSGVATAVLLGSRNALYALRLGPLLRPRRRAVAAHLVIDESTAMALAQPAPEAAREAFWATGVSVFVLWNVATLAGALAGESLGDPRSLGLDAAVAAAFLALLWPRLTTSRARLVAAGAAVLALGVTPYVAAGVPVLAAALVAVAGGVRE